MYKKPYKRSKKGAGRHVQLPEHLQATRAWTSLKPGPRALYIELKRRFNGSNNGRIILSHRDAAKAINVHRNTIGSYFADLEERGFIHQTQGHYLGPSGVGQSAHWALDELPTIDGKPAKLKFRVWGKTEKPRTMTVPPRHKQTDTSNENDAQRREPVLKIVTGN